MRLAPPAGYGANLTNLFFLYQKKDDEHQERMIDTFTTLVRITSSFSICLVTSHVTRLQYPIVAGHHGPAWHAEGSDWLANARSTLLVTQRACSSRSCVSRPSGGFCRYEHKRLVNHLNTIWGLQCLWTPIQHDLATWDLVKQPSRTEYAAGCVHHGR